MMAREMRQVWSSGVRGLKLMRRLLRYLTHESVALFVLGGATAILQCLLLVPIALIVREMFDTAIPHQDVGAIVTSGVVILALYATSAALGYVSRVAAIRMAVAAGRHLRLDVLAKLYSLPHSWHDTNLAGEVHSIAVRDTERAETMLATLAGMALPATVVAVALVVVALLISPILVLTALAVVPALLFVARILVRRMRRQRRQWATTSRNFSAQLQLLLRAMPTTRAAGAESTEIDRGAQRAGDLARDYRAFGVSTAAVYALQNAIAATAGTAVLVVGGIEVAHHNMTLGDLLGFYAVLGLLLRQVHTIGFQSDVVMIGLQSLADIESLLAIDASAPYGEGGLRLEFRGGISVAGVNFAYEDDPVLTEIDLAIAPSERVTVVGPNGAGKSTLVNLLLGLYKPQSGVLKADDIRYDELDIRHLRRQIGVVLQDPVLLPGTIRENIAYAKPDASDSAIREAAEVANASGFIEALPNGYSTRVGDEGAGLSGGQRQRIAIARALLGSPALLILDEPTTYLDEAAVSALMARLLALPHAPTVLLVTHDPQVANHAERVIELRDGNVVSDAQLAPSGG
jgi:ABC-type bacteriocin/lantibiotic exporter with double-glycine peptidase domain